MRFLRGRLFVVIVALFAIALSVTLNHGWPQQPPNEVEEITYPDDLQAGSELVIRARLDKADDATDCIVAASMMIQFAGRLSFTRLTAQRTTGEFSRDAVSGLPAGNVEYRIEVPKRVKAGPARVFIRESYFCESRTRVAFVNAMASQVMILAKEPDLPAAAT